MWGQKVPETAREDAIGRSADGLTNDSKWHLGGKKWCRKQDSNL
jgi:hypothetical protein